MEELAKGLMCGRCGAAVGHLTACPRCGATLAGQSPAEPREDLVRYRRQRRRALSRAAMGAVLVTAALGTCWWILTREPPGERQAQAQGVAAQQPPPAPSPSHVERTQAAPETDETTTETTPETAQDDGTPQAEAVEALLSGSHSSRSSLSEAITAAGRCERSGVTDIARITASRREQLAEARQLDVTALAGGEAVKRTLVEALDSSHRADAAFHAWARRYQDGGCTGPVAGDRDYRRGLAHSESAQEAKRRFVDAWRPLAQTYGLTEWTADDI
ncbi:hypothetical protein ACIBH1_34900 [Nonomuraea sp. NPDC050663]|uniref:hypothetical protein n=1 Tax=Nonomuraea sp. NPDC050663 TaxID=3364370 RepID=UPI0037BC3DB7